MRKYYMIAATAVISAAITAALPALKKTVISAPPWKLMTSAVASQTSPATPTFEPPARIIGKNSGRRIFLFHGLPGYAGFWDSSETQRLLDALINSGAQVVVVKLPDAKHSFFQDGGDGYCRALSTWFRSMRQGVASSHGEADEYTLGVSYGGLHAMMTAEDPAIDGWVAISPVVDVSRLTEFRFQSSKDCRPSAEIIGRKPSLMIYGANDKRVGTDLIEQAAQAIRDTGPAAFSAIKLDLPNHAMTPEVTAKTVEWFGRLVRRCDDGLDCRRLRRRASLG